MSEPADAGKHAASSSSDADTSFRVRDAIISDLMKKQDVEEKDVDDSIYKANELYILLHNFVVSMRRDVLNIDLRETFSTSLTTTSREPNSAVRVTKPRELSREQKHSEWRLGRLIYYIQLRREKHFGTKSSSVASTDVRALSASGKNKKLFLFDLYDSMSFDDLNHINNRRTAVMSCSLFAGWLRRYPFLDNAMVQAKVTVRGADLDISAATDTVVEYIAGTSEDLETVSLEINRRVCYIRSALSFVENASVGKPYSGLALCSLMVDIFKAFDKPFLFSKDDSKSLSSIRIGVSRDDTYIHKVDMKSVEAAKKALINMRQRSAENSSKKFVYAENVLARYFRYYDLGGISSDPLRRNNLTNIINTIIGGNGLDPETTRQLLGNDDESVSALVYFLRQYRHDIVVDYVQSTLNDFVCEKSSEIADSIVRVEKEKSVSDILQISGLANSDLIRQTLAGKSSSDGRAFLTMRPDIVCLRRDGRLLLCEVKTTSGAVDSRAFLEQRRKGESQYVELITEINKALGFVSWQSEFIIQSTDNFESSWKALSDFYARPDSFDNISICINVLQYHDDPIRMARINDMIRLCSSARTVVNIGSAAVARRVARLRGAYVPSGEDLISDFNRILAEVAGTETDSSFFDAYDENTISRLREKINDILSTKEGNYVPSQTPKISFHLPLLREVRDRDFKQHRDEELINYVVKRDLLASDPKSELTVQLFFNIALISQDVKAKSIFYGDIDDDKEAERTKELNKSMENRIAKGRRISQPDEAVPLTSRRSFYTPSSTFNSNQFGRQAHIAGSYRRAEDMKDYKFLDLETSIAGSASIRTLLTSLGSRETTPMATEVRRFIDDWKYSVRAGVEECAAGESYTKACREIEEDIETLSGTTAFRWTIANYLWSQSCARELSKKKNLKFTSVLTGFSNCALGIMGPGSETSEKGSRPMYLLFRSDKAGMSSLVKYASSFGVFDFYDEVIKDSGTKYLEKCKYDDMIEGRSYLAISDWRRYTISDMNARMNSASRALMTMLYNYQQTKLVEVRSSVASMIACGLSSHSTKMLKPITQLMVNMTAACSQYARHLERKVFTRPQSNLQAFVMLSCVDYVERCVRKRIAKGRTMDPGSTGSRSVASSLVKGEKFSAPQLWEKGEYSSFQMMLDDMYIYHLTSRTQGSIDHSLRKAHETIIEMNSKYKKDKDQLNQEFLEQDPRKSCEILRRRLREKSLFYKNKLAVHASAASFVRRFADGERSRIVAALEGSGSLSFPLASMTLMTTKSNSRIGDAAGVNRVSNFESAMRILLDIDPNITVGEAINVLTTLMDNSARRPLRTLDDLVAARNTQRELDEYNVTEREIQAFEIYLRQQFGEDREIYIQNIITKLINFVVEHSCENLCRQIPNEFITKRDRVWRMECQLTDMIQKGKSRAVESNLKTALAREEAKLAAIIAEEHNDNKDDAAFAARATKERISQRITALRRKIMLCEKTDFTIFNLNGDCAKWSLSQDMDVLAEFFIAITGNRSSPLLDLMLYSLDTMKEKTIRFDKSIFGVASHMKGKKLREPVKLTIDTLFGGSDSKLMAEYDIEVGWPQGVYNKFSTLMALATMAHAEELFNASGGEMQAIIDGLRHSDDWNDIVLTGDIEVAKLYYKCNTYACLCLNIKMSPDKVTIHNYVREFISDYFLNGINYTSFQKFLATVGSNMSADNFADDVMTICSKTQKLIETGLPATSTMAYVCLSYVVLTHLWSITPRNYTTIAMAADSEVKALNPTSSVEALRMLRIHFWRQLYRRPIEVIGLVPPIPELIIFSPSDLNMARCEALTKKLFSFSDRSDLVDGDTIARTIGINTFSGKNKLESVLKRLRLPSEPDETSRDIIEKGLVNYRLPNDSELRLRVLVSKLYTKGMKMAFSLFDDDANMKRYAVASSGRVWKRCSTLWRLKDIVKEFDEYEIPAASIQGSETAFGIAVPAEIREVLASAIKVIKATGTPKAVAYGNRLWLWRRNESLRHLRSVTVNSLEDLELARKIGISLYLKSGYENRNSGSLKSDLESLGMPLDGSGGVLQTSDLLKIRAQRKIESSFKFTRTCSSYSSFESFLWAIGRGNLNWMIVEEAPPELVKRKPEAFDSGGIFCVTNFIMKMIHVGLANGKRLPQISELIKRSYPEVLDFLRRADSTHTSLFDSISELKTTHTSKASIAACAEWLLYDRIGVTTDMLSSHIVSSCRKYYDDITRDLTFEIRVEDIHITVSTNTKGELSVLNFHAIDGPEVLPLDKICYAVRKRTRESISDGVIIEQLVKMSQRNYRDDLRVIGEDDMFFDRNGIKITELEYRGRITESIMLLNRRRKSERRQLLLHEVVVASGEEQNMKVAAVITVSGAHVFRVSPEGLLGVPEGPIGIFNSTINYAAEYNAFICRYNEKDNSGVAESGPRIRRLLCGPEDPIATKEEITALCHQSLKVRNKLIAANEELLRKLTESSKRTIGRSVTKADKEKKKSGKAKSSASELSESEALIESLAERVSMEARLNAERATMGSDAESSYEELFEGTAGNEDIDELSDYTRRSLSNFERVEAVKVALVSIVKSRSTQSLFEMWSDLDILLASVERNYDSRHSQLTKGFVATMVEFCIQLEKIIPRCVASLSINSILGRATEWIEKITGGLDEETFDSLSNEAQSAAIRSTGLINPMLLDHLNAVINASDVNIRISDLMFSILGPVESDSAEVSEASE